MASWPSRPMLLVVLLLVCTHIVLCSSSSSSASKPKTSSRKALLASDDEDSKPAKMARAAASAKSNKKLASDTKNQTKLLKPIKPKKSESTTTKTKTTKTKNAEAEATVKTKPAKPDKTASTKLKSTGSTKSPKLSKTNTKTAKTPKSETTGKIKKPSKSISNIPSVATKSSKKAQEATELKEDNVMANKTEEVAAAVPFAEEDENTEDLISEFRGLPGRLQETLMPDLERLSSTSNAYLSAANAGITEGVRPLLGGRWAAAGAAAVVLLLLLSLFMLTALVRRMSPYLPLLHHTLLLTQAYLAIYFATLALAAAATGLEPLRFFHAASPAAYAWTQAAQSLGYVAYLMLQMVDLVAVFSAASPESEGAGEAAKALGLAQMVVGLAVGLHYYAAVFHRAAAGEAPRANWRVYAVYAACFAIVCACARAEKRKKAYLADSDDGAVEWKKS